MSLAGGPQVPCWGGARATGRGPLGPMLGGGWRGAGGAMSRGCWGQGVPSSTMRARAGDRRVPQGQYSDTYKKHYLPATWRAVMMSH